MQHFWFGFALELEPREPGMLKEERQQEQKEQYQSSIYTCTLIARFSQNELSKT